MGRDSPLRWGCPKARPLQEWEEEGAQGGQSCLWALEACSPPAPPQLLPGLQSPAVCTEQCQVRAERLLLPEG